VELKVTSCCKACALMHNNNNNATREHQTAAVRSRQPDWLLYVDRGVVPGP
jgi:hypothetical protein